jgi:hypothetical protein
MAREIKLPVGDGNANVNVTRGFKTWFSTREGGLTVESTVNVSIKCNQKEQDIRAAIENSSIIAESEAIAGSEEMGLHIDAFAKDVGGR